MKIIIFLLLLLKVNLIFGVEKFSSRDCALLIPFFQTLIKHTEVGYVIYDQKPVCVEGFAINTCTFEPPEWHQISVAINGVKEILERPIFKSGNIIFLIDEKRENLIIINRRLFLKTIQDNLSLFQYVLGPTVTPDSLLNSLLAKQSFMKVFNYDKVLMGIVLGYGVQNSIYVSRLEELQEEVFTFDTPPLIPKADLCFNDFDRKIFLFFPTKSELKRIALLKEARQKNTPRREPSMGFASLNDEVKYLSNKIENSSKALVEEKPFFIFGRLDSENKLISSLETTQKKIQDFISNFSFSEIFQIISGEQVEVESSKNSIPFFKVNVDINLAAAKLLRGSLYGYEKEYLDCFAEGLLGKKDNFSESKEPLLGFAESLANMKVAKKNVNAADVFFAQLKKNKKIVPLLEDFLYYEVIQKGFGQRLTDEIEVLLDYEIFDISGKCLEKQKNVKINLLQTISGFAHGVRGMTLGETRTIYIHPSLGYGIHTYLEKGSYLIAAVKLLEIGDKNGELPGLKPLPISFVCSDNFQKYCEEEHKKNLRYLGALRAEFLKKCSGIDLQQVASVFKSLQEQDDDLSSSESEALYQLFWMHYFACSEVGHQSVRSPS